MPKALSRLSVFALVALTAVVAQPAFAKPLSRMLADSPMSPGDFDAMRAAEAALYGHADVKVGSSVKWSNPETGTYGVIKVSSKPSGCVVMRHMAHPKGATPAREITRKFCKGADGKWLLSE